MFLPRWSDHEPHTLCEGELQRLPLLKSSESSKDENKYTIYPKLRRRNDAGKPGRIGRGAGEEVTAQPHSGYCNESCRSSSLALALLTFNQTAKKGLKKCILFSFVGK